jgi:alpha-1,2-mannosyltransferase
MIAATVVALGVRLFTLSRPGFLTQSTEYDDGVYLGAAIRLTQGVMPYKDFAFVQPPGILLLMSPVALFARATSTVAGLALARIATVLASVACVPLAGNLVRFRGTLVTGLTCFILAIYPADIATAHTLLLEPWMNLLVLIAANLAFSGGRVSSSAKRLAGAGVLIGFAGVVKFWSGAPAVVLLVIVALACRSAAKNSAAENSAAENGEPGAWRRLVAYLSGLVAAFVLPVLPFLASAPGTFVRSTVSYQAARTGSFVPLSERLAHITGVIDLLDYWGRITLTAGSNSVFGQAVDADTTPTSPHALPFVAAGLLVAVVAAGYVLARKTLTQVEWFALATCVGALAAILGYSAFFYHYPAFPGPWLAIVAAVSLATLTDRCASIGRGAGAWRGVPVRRLAAVGAGLVLAFACVLQLCEVSGLATPKGADQISSLIPAGACVVTDETALVIAANRFEASKPGCPVVVDSLATTLVLTGGQSVQGGADTNKKAIAAWQAMLLKAQYVWLSPNHWKRIPFGYNSAQWTWFTGHFRQIAPAPDAKRNWILGIGQLFVRDS